MRLTTGKDGRGGQQSGKRCTSSVCPGGPANKENAPQKLIQTTVFIFYENQLYRLMVDYERSETKGMTDRDMGSRREQGHAPALTAAERDYRLKRVTCRKRAPSASQPSARSVSVSDRMRASAAFLVLSPVDTVIALSSPVRRSTLQLKPVKLRM